MTDSVCIAYDFFPITATYGTSGIFSQHCHIENHEKKNGLKYVLLLTKFPKAYEKCGSNYLRKVFFFSKTS